MKLTITLEFDGTGLNPDQVSDLLDNVVKLVAGEPGSNELSSEDVIQIAEKYTGTESMTIGDEVIV